MENGVMYSYERLLMSDSVQPESPTLAFTSSAHIHDPVLGPWKVYLPAGQDF